MILQYILKKEDTDKTINQIIEKEFNLSSRLFNKLLRNKKILLNGINIDTRMSANTEDIISIDLDYIEDNSNILPTKMNLNILYEDNGLLIINKPAGISVHPSISHYKDSLSNGVRYYFDSVGIYKKIRPVNRLDLNTSGIIIFAKNEFIQENLIRQMGNGTFKKEYLAIAKGHFHNKYGIINAPIGRKENSIIERCITEDGQNSITEYEVLNEFCINFEILSLVKCKLLTGRTHQIRVHMKYIDHPLLGDSLYDSSSNLINRQALHSSKVSFLHPITKENFELFCDLPNDFKYLCEKQIFN